jgi:hypothetical protein
MIDDTRADGTRGGPGGSSPPGNTDAEAPFIVFANGLGRLVVIDETRHKDAYIKH